MSSRSNYVRLKRDHATVALQNHRKLGRMYNVTLSEAEIVPTSHSECMLIVKGDRMDIENASRYIDSLVNRDTTKKTTVNLNPWFTETLIEGIEKQSNAVLEKLKTDTYEIRGLKNQVILALDLIEEILKESIPSTEATKVSRRLSSSIRDTILKSNRKVSNCLNASEKVKRAILGILDTDKKTSAELEEGELILISDSEDDTEEVPAIDSAFYSDTDEQDVSIMIIDTPDRPITDSKRVGKSVGDTLITNLTNKFQDMQTPSKVDKSRTHLEYQNATNDENDKCQTKNTNKTTGTISSTEHATIDQEQRDQTKHVFGRSKNSNSQLKGSRVNKPQTCVIRPFTQQPSTTGGSNKVPLAREPIVPIEVAKIPLPRKPTLPSEATKPPRLSKPKLRNETDRVKHQSNGTERKLATPKRDRHKRQKDTSTIKNIEFDIPKDTLNSKDRTVTKRKRETDLENDLSNEQRVFDSKKNKRKDKEESKRRRYNSEEDEVEIISSNKQKTKRKEGNTRKPKESRKSRHVEDLRYIVIDGSNVAMAHGKNKIFSCRGLQLCVDYFKKRGHSLITVFLPMWRKCRPREPASMTERHVLDDLEEEGHLVYTPSRRIGSRLVASYDDRFILELAERENGVVVSNDQYRDLMNDKSSWRNIIEERLLMYTFVRDNFMVPEDPLGRHGPTLDVFLRNTRYHKETADSFMQHFKQLNSLYPYDPFEASRSLISSRDPYAYRR